MTCAGRLYLKKNHSIDVWRFEGLMFLLLSLSILNTASQQTTLIINHIGMEMKKSEEKMDAWQWKGNEGWCMTFLSQPTSISDRYRCHSHGSFVNLFKMVTWRIGINVCRRSARLPTSRGNCRENTSLPHCDGPKGLVELETAQL